jgi:nucleoside phosphorylase
MKLAKIGVLGAMQQEIALLLQNMKNVQERNIGEGKGARTYWHGFLYGNDSNFPVFTTARVYRVSNQIG